MTATKTSGHAPAKPDVLASLPRQDRHKPKGPPMRKSKVSRWRAMVLIGVHVLIALHIWHWLQTGETITPVEPSEAMETVELGRINAGFLLFLGLIATTLIFGRFFCGWACHVVALQDLSAWLLAKAGLKPRPVRSRLLVFAPWVVGGYMFLWPVVEHWLWPQQKFLPAVADWQLQLTTTDLWRTFPGPIMTIASVLVVGGLIVWWLGAKGFCTYGCPYGAFFATVDRFAPIRIKVDATKCEACGHCTQACSSNVRVHEEVAKYQKVVDPGCMKCLDCVSVCPTGALSVGFAAPKPFAISQQRIHARADFRWWEEVFLAVVAVVAVQWTFRGAWFGESIPLLLSVGLGVITAVLLLLLLRLLTRPEVTFQHTTWKQQRKLTGAGKLAFVGLGLWAVFVGHTFVGQRLRQGAMDAAREPLRASIYGGRNFDPADAVAARDRIAAVRSWVLVADPQLREVHALLRGSTGDHAGAEAELRARFAAGPLQLPEAKMALANYFARSAAELPAAERLLAEVVDANPANAAAQMLLQRVRAKLGR